MTTCLAEINKQKLTLSMCKLNANVKMAKRTKNTANI